MLPATDVQSIRSTIPASGLADAQRILGNIRSDYQRCQNAYQALRTWQNLPVKKNSKGKVIPKPAMPTIPPDCPPAPTPASGGSS